MIGSLVFGVKEKTKVKREKMRRGKVGVLLLCVSALVMGWCMSPSSAAFFGKHQNRSGRKSLLPGESTSSLELNRVGSSVVFPLHGNVYPIGYVHSA